MNTEDNIHEIVERLFSELPREENSIQLQLEEESYFIAREDYSNYIFELMCLITLGGIEFLYGHRNIMNLTETQFNIINSYIKSIGYSIVLETNGLPETPWELIRLDIPIENYKISFEPNSP